MNALGWTASSTFSYTQSKQNTQFVRLNSQVTWDDPVNLRRTLIGDLQAASGPLGGGGSLGGISISKHFALNPFLITSPILNLSGHLMTPSEVEIYVNKILVRTEQLSPGPSLF